MKTKDKPILFSAPMVRAVLRKVNPKTMTRRVVKGEQQKAGVFADLLCPYGKKRDRLWVRETFAYPINGDMVGYKATYPPKEYEDIAPDIKRIKWKRSIFMPLWASRIILELTDDVRVERLQEITEEDARREGIFEIWDGAFHWEKNTGISAGDTAGDAFAWLWDSINKTRGYSWADNPEVAVIPYQIWRIYER